MSMRIVTVADGYESSSVPGVADIVGIRVYPRTLTTPEFNSKSMLLSITPGIASTVMVHWQGVLQTPDEDFYVDGAYIKWDTKNLDAVIAAGDKLNISYQ
jgi:hypothetical protein